MSNDLLSNILVGAAHALAHVEGLRQVLQALLDPIAGDNIGRRRSSLPAQEAAWRSLPAWGSTMRPRPD